MKYSYEILSRRARPRAWIVRVLRADRAVRRVLARRSDVLFSSGLTEVEVASTLLVTRWLGIPDVVVTASGPTDVRVRNPVADRLRTLLYPTYSAALVPGSSHADSLRGLGVDDERIFISYYAVPGEQYREAAKTPKELSGEPPLLFVGRLSHEKGVDLLIDAVDRVAGGAHLHIVGDGSLKGELQAQTEGSGARDRIYFHGFVAREELGAWYAGAALLIVPSVTEPWGLVVNEAMEVGTPALTSDHVGAASVLVRSGYSGETFRSGDVEDLTAKLAALLEEPGTLARLVDGAIERVSRCTFENAAEAWGAAARFAASGPRRRGLAFGRRRATG